MKNKLYILTIIGLLIFVSVPFVLSQPRGKGIVSIAEEDLDPTIFPWQIKVTNATLTDNLDGTASLSISGTGAPVNADYLVGTANATLTNEIIVGTTPGGELGNTWASPTIDDNVAVTGWNLTTPTITTSLTTSTPKTLTVAELDRLDGLAGIIVTDNNACTDVEGTLLSITTGTLNATEAQTLAAVLALGADANDVNITSLAKLEGIDATEYVDMSIDGQTDVVAGVNIDLNAPTITFPNATKPRKRVYISATAGLVPDTTGCADAAQTELGNTDINRINVMTCDFDASSDEYWTAHFTLPENYDGGTFTSAVSWTCTADASKGVAWFIQLLGMSDGDVMGATDFGTAVEMNDDGETTNDYLLTAESGAITENHAGGNGTAVGGDELWVKLYRDVSDADDDLTTDGKMIGLWLTFPIDALSTED